MKQFIALIMCALMLSACGTFKKTTKTDETVIKAETETEIKEGSTTTQTIDTVVNVPSDTIEGARPLSELLDNSVLIFEDPEQSVEVRYDKPTKTIRAKAIVKARAIPVKQTIKTTSWRTENTETDIKATDNHEQTDTKKTSPLIPGWVWLIVLLVLIALIALRLGLFRLPF